MEECQECQGEGVCEYERWQRQCRDTCMSHMLSIVYANVCLGIKLDILLESDDD